MNGVAENGVSGGAGSGVAGNEGATPPFSIHRELARLPAETRQVYEARLNELDAYMHQTTPYGVRDDSRLAFRFVSGEVTHWPWWAVAHEMACTQYLCEAAPYQRDLQPFLRGLANRLKEESGADWRRVWAAVAELGPELLKLDLMHQARLGMPDFQPVAIE